MLKSVRAVIIKLRLSCLLKTNDSTTKYNRKNRFIFNSDEGKKDHLIPTNLAEIKRDGNCC